ncbi:MAG: hypothetical protein RL215_1927 [Planctomycetota bacterium]|jgi:hypothetical protein
MASKDNNGLVISLSIFVLLTVGLGVAWYMTWTHSTDLTRDLAAARKAESDSKGIITGLNQDLDALKRTIGRPEPEVDDIINNAKLEIARRAGNGTTIPDTVEGAMVMNATERDTNRANAEERRVQLETKINELNAAVQNHQNSMKSLQDEVAAKEAQLLAQEKTHGEQLKQREDQIDELKTQLTSVQTAFSEFREEKEREITTLRDEISLQRDTLKKLRAAKFSLENLNFERPAGHLTFVEQTTNTAWVDLGSRDQLRVGTTFSVYRQPNGGVGLAQSDKDIKGKLVITEILGPSLARADIVEPKLGEPMAVGDPIYSPIFTPGRAMEIAVVGGLDFDGNPGSDRDEFRRMVASNGASIILEVNDEAKVLGRDGAQISEADIYSAITSNTRFVLIGDLGDDNTQDTVQREINNRIRAIKVKMEQAATDNGVYVLSLSRFLDYIGYSRKSLAWSPTRPFPATLPNGAKSSSVNATFGGRQSSAVISGAFSGRSARPLPSTGSTSALYRGTTPED